MRPSRMIDTVMTAVKDAALVSLLFSTIALKRVEAALSAMEKASLVVFLSAMVLMSFCQVALRQLFGTGILWGDTLSRHMVLWAGFFGAALAAAEGKHFAWETAVAALKGRAQAWAKALAGLSTAVIAAGLARASWLFFVDDKAAGNVLFTAGDLAVPSWAYSIVYPAGFALLSLHFLIQAALAGGDAVAPGWLQGSPDGASRGGGSPSGR
ncbi:MAG: TRAP transporter small permease [Elusimicrobia bacterium]|nr:TRAP transporter small permease [Elusimicrobiota bacterium]